MPRLLVWLLIALPVAVFGWLLLTYAVNVPWFDDIETFVGFYAEYLQALTASERLWWLLKPNNEHRVFFGKVVAVAITYLTGELNFRYVILVGGLCLLGTLGILFRVFRWGRGSSSQRLPLALFVPVPFVLLQPQYHLASLWAITSMQHIGATFFVMSSLYLLAHSRSAGRYWGAVGLQTMAALSMSNGLFGWVAGAGILLAQRRFGKFGIWLVISVLVFWFYFRDFSSPQGNESSVSFFLKHPHLIIFGFFTFIGGLFDFFPKLSILPRAVLPTLMGMGMVASTLYLLWQDWKHLLKSKPAGGRRPVGPHSSFLLGAYTYLLVNALAIGFLRPRFGYEVMLISNYMLYPALWVCLLYLHWVSRHPALRHGRSLALGIGMLVWLMAYNLHWPTLHERRQRLLAFAFNQHHTGAGLGGMRGTPLGHYIEQTMQTAVQAGYYHYPAIDSALPDSLLQRPAATFGPLLNVPVSIAEQPDRFQIELLIKPPLVAGQPAYLVLQSATHTYLLTSESPLRLVAAVAGRPVVALKAEALRGMFRPGAYRLGWVTLDGGKKPIVRYTNQLLMV
jgi:hypothetical protein